MLACLDPFTIQLILFTIHKIHVTRCINIVLVWHLRLNIKFKPGGSGGQPIFATKITFSREIQTTNFNYKNLVLKDFRLAILYVMVTLTTHV